MKARQALQNDVINLTAGLTNGGRKNAEMAREKAQK
jgi:hypothetical protein